MFAAALLTAALVAPPPSPTPPAPTIDAAMLEQLTYVCKADYDAASSKIVLGCAVLGPDGTVAGAEAMEGPTGPLGTLDAGITLAVWMDSLGKLLLPLVKQPEQTGV